MNHLLNFVSIESNPNLVPEPVFNLAMSLDESARPLVAEIDPSFTGSKEFCEHYGVNPSDGANCIVIEVVKGSERTLSACLVPIGYRADLNSFVRKHFNARRVSFAPLEEVEPLTKMEYGSITVFGLPLDWKVLVDSRIMNNEKVIIGGGKKVSKLIILTETIKNLPNVEVVEGLSKPV